MSKYTATKTHLAGPPVDGHGKTVLKSPDFESGIVKVIWGDEEKLTAAEASSLRRLERVEEDSDDDEDMTFAEECEAGVKTRDSTYINLQWIPGTSNEVARLYSRAGLASTERRHRLYPTTLEKLLMLEYNDSYWDVYTVAEALRKASIARKDNSKKKQRTGNIVEL